MKPVLIIFIAYIFNSLTFTEMIFLNKSLLLLASLLVSSNMIAQQNPVHEQDKYVLVLDIQKHFTQKVIADTSALNLIGTINSIIECSDPQKVIYVQSILSTVSLSSKGLIVDTLPDLELDERLKVVNNQLFTKNKANAFLEPDITSFLKDRDAKEIIVIGLMAEHCVRQTLLAGEKAGYKMYVIPEAVRGRSAESTAKTIAKLSKRVSLMKIHYFLISDIIP